MTLSGTFKTIDFLYNVAKKHKPSGDVFPTGFKEFDVVMDGGVREGELITISGPTAGGKTTFAQHLVINFNNKKIPSLFFSYEMSPYYLEQKFISMGHNPIDLAVYSPIELIEKDLKFIDQEICEAKGEAVKIIFIDHLHYLIPLNLSGNASLVVGEVVRTLKRMAVKRNVIIFLIAHTKKIYQDEKLSLVSIRDSSLISQESDFVFLIERLRKDQKKLENTGTEWTNQTQISLAKNRRTGKMPYVNYLFQNNKFISID